ncbi:YesL family protein [Butyrivibrio sp. JL13D10]|uniref:YesL family protein n=1 Tax=Butyrivibrio sp. JL13D10 TaxID=3236815 RepID=UPI0038B4A5FB
MGKFFDMDSPLMRALNRVADLMILNLVVLVFVLIPFTGGAALTGMHYVLLKMVRDEETYVVKGFWKSFKLNFKQSTILWIIMMILAGIIGVDFLWVRANATVLPSIYTYIMLGITLILYMISLYIFPLQSRFDNPIKNTLKNACMFSILGLPRTVGMAVVSMIPLVLLYFFDIRIVPILIMFGFTGPAYLMALMYNGLFKKFEPKVEGYDDGEEVRTDDDDEELQAAIKRMQEARDKK